MDLRQSSMDRIIMSKVKILDEDNLDVLLAALVSNSSDLDQKYCNIVDAQNLLDREDSQYLKPLLQKAHKEGNFDQIRSLRTRPLVFNLIHTDRRP